MDNSKDAFKELENETQAETAVTKVVKSEVAELTLKTVAFCPFSNKKNYSYLMPRIMMTL